MKMTLKMASSLVVATVLGMAACGDDGTAIEPLDDGGTPSPDSGPRRDGGDGDPDRARQVLLAR